MQLWDLEDMRTRGTKDGTTDLNVLLVVIQSQHLFHLSHPVICEQVPDKSPMFKQSHKTNEWTMDCQQFTGTHLHRCACWRNKSHLEVDVGSFSNHAETEGRRVNSSITFSKDEKVILGKIGELGKETQQGPVIICGDLKEQQRWAGLKV